MSGETPTPVLIVSTAAILFLVAFTVSAVAMCFLILRILLCH